MKNFFSKNRFEIVFWLAITTTYFFSRLLNLAIIPIFTDEAIYLRWAQIMAYDASLRYLPLVDGKPPLFMWFEAALIRLFQSLDPLIAGRVAAVFSGALGALGIYAASYQLFQNKRIAFLSVALYILVPFTFFYDRIGLADSLLAALGIWSLAFAITLAKKIRLDSALLLGITTGLGLLTKSPAIFFLLFLPLTLLVFDFTKKTRWRSLAKWLCLIAVAVILSQAIYSILRLFPLFSMISQKNQEFAVPPGELLRHPLLLLPGNASSLFRWEIGYLTFPISILVIASLLTGILSRSREKLLLFASFAIFFFAVAAANKIIFPRFILTFTPMLLILAATFLDEIITGLKHRTYLLAFGALLAFPLIFVDAKLMFDPVTAPIPDADSNQYLNSWSAGYGVSEVRSLLSDIAKKQKKVTVATEGTFGLMPYSLQLYQKDYPNLEIKDYWPLPEKTPPEINSAAKDHQTYIIIYQRQSEPSGWKLIEVLRYRQGIGKDYLRLYRVLPL